MPSHRVKEIAAEARKNPNVFMEFVFRVKQSECHRALQRHLQENMRCAVLAHRDFGKTTQTLGHILWKIGNDPERLIKIVCSDDEPAKDRITFLREHIDTNKRLHLVFPRLKKSTKIDNWGKKSLTVERSAIVKDASIEAAGVLTQAEGARATDLFFDDICDLMNTIRYPTKRALVRQAFNQSWMPLLDPDKGWAAYLATIHHVDDQTSHLLKNTEWKWVDFSVTGEPPVSPWHEKWTTAKLCKRRKEIGTIEFDRAYRNLLHSDEERIIQEAWTKHLFHTIERKDLRVASWDSATAKKGDRAASGLADFDYANKIIRVNLAEAWKGLTLRKIVEKILQFHEQWKPDIHIVETGNALGVAVANDEDLAGIPIYRFTTSGRGSKEERLRASSVWYEQSRVLFHEGTTADAIAELLAFPKGASDDLVDVLTMIVLYATEKMGKAFEPNKAASSGVRTFRTAPQESGELSVKRQMRIRKGSVGGVYW